ncbi:response regulator transcription factor [Deferrisoma palaeochoriense]
MDLTIQNPPPRAAAATTRVLVIDDDPALVRFVELFLEPEGFQVDGALSGAEGVERAKEHPPDAILLDLMLPDMDGWEVLRELKAQPQTAGVPVVVVTARSGGEDRMRSLELGADDLVAKPFDIRELQARIASAVSRVRQQALLTEAEKIKTLRRVVASVSHEVNNPLAAILMCAEALERRHADNEDVLKKSRTIQSNVLRIRDILKKLERVRAVVSKPYVAGERILEIEGLEEDS